MFSLLFPYEAFHVSGTRNHAVDTLSRTGLIFSPSFHRPPNPTIPTVAASRHVPLIDLLLLEVAVQRLFEFSLASLTRSSYFTAQKHYLFFCSSFGLSPSPFLSVYSLLYWPTRVCRPLSSEAPSNLHRAPIATHQLMDMAALWHKKITEPTLMGTPPHYHLNPKIAA